MFQKFTFIIELYFQNIVPVFGILPNLLNLLFHFSAKKMQFQIWKEYHEFLLLGVWWDILAVKPDMKGYRLQFLRWVVST